MTLNNIFNINQDIVKINHSKNVKFFNQNNTNIAIKTGKYVKKTEKYNLVLKITILHLKNRFLYIIYSNFYLKKFICKVY